MVLPDIGPIGVVMRVFLCGSRFGVARFGKCARLGRALATTSDLRAFRQGNVAAKVDCTGVS